MVVPLLCALVVADLGTGCRRRKPSASPPAEAGLSQPGEPVAATPGSKAASTIELEKIDLESELVRITDAAQTYGSVKSGGRRVVIPASVEELVKGGFLVPAPVAPPGKRFIINQKTGEAEVVNQ